MSEPWGTREQPSEPQPAEPEPTPLGAEHLLLAVGGVSFTTACVLALVDQAGVTDAVRGLYSILTGLFVVGITGYLVRSGQARVRSRVDCYAHLVLDRLAELTSQVDALTAAVNELGEAGTTAGETGSAETWWSGYATALEDQESGVPRTVLPFRQPHGDRSGDSRRGVNGSELL